MEPVADKQAIRAKTEKKKVAVGNEQAQPQEKVKTAYVPPPPPDGDKIPPPAGAPPVKTFPISTGPPPIGMSFPGIEAAAAPEKKDGEAAGQGGGGQEGQDAAPGEEEEVDDGFTPE